MLWYGFVSEGLEAILARARSVYRGRRLERRPLRPDLVVIEGADTCEGLKQGFKVKAFVRPSMDFLLASSLYGIR